MDSTFFKFRLGAFTAGSTTWASGDDTCIFEPTYVIYFRSQRSEERARSRTNLAIGGGTDSHGAVGSTDKKMQTNAETGNTDEGEAEFDSDAEPLPVELDPEGVQSELALLVEDGDEFKWFLLKLHQNNLSWALECPVVMKGILQSDQQRQVDFGKYTSTILLLSLLQPMRKQNTAMGEELAWIGMAPPTDDGTGIGMVHGAFSDGLKSREQPGDF